MRTKLAALVLFASALLVGCPHPVDREAPGPRPINPPDTDLCSAMCQHLGPKDKGGLGCEEGMPVYDSDKPGPANVPNTSCEDFCKTSQDRGVFLNPRCLKLVPSCDKIEEFRKHKPETCTE